jgi:hypothetical protein
MTTTTEALQALVSELEAAAVYAAVSAARGTKATEANMRNLDARRAALASALAEVVKDAERVDWLEDDNLHRISTFGQPGKRMWFMEGFEHDGVRDFTSIRALADAALAARSAEQKGV